MNPQKDTQQTAHTLFVHIPLHPSFFDQTMRAKGVESHWVAWLVLSAEARNALSKLIYGQLADTILGAELLAPPAPTDGPPRPNFKPFLSGLDFLALFHVSDWRRGGAVIRHRIETLGLLPGARISRYDSAEQIYRAFYPLEAPAMDPEKLLHALSENTDQAMAISFGLLKKLSSPQ